MSGKISDFIGKLLIHYPVRFDTEARQDEWIDSLTAAFRSYSADVLQRAAQRIVDTRTDRRFPLVAEIHKVCAQIIYDDGIKQQSLGVVQDPEKATPYSESRERWADTLVNGELGREAAREGWILALHDYAREHGKLPDRPGAARLKASVAGFERELDRCRGGGWELAPFLVQLGTSMLERREKLTDMVLHGVVR